MLMTICRKLDGVLYPIFVMPRDSVHTMLWMLRAYDVGGIYLVIN